VNKRAATEKGDDRVFSHYQPKGKKRSVREYLKSGEPEDRFHNTLKYTDNSYVPQVIEKPTEVEYRPIPEIDKKYTSLPTVLTVRRRRTFKTPANGEFFRSRSKRRIRPNEELSETEDDVTEDWLMIKHEEVHPPNPVSL